MMRPADALPVVYVCRGAIDFRKGLHALAVLVESQLKRDPFSTQLYVFGNRGRTGGEDPLLGAQWLLLMAEEA